MYLLHWVGFLSFLVFHFLYGADYPHHSLAPLIPYFSIFLLVRYAAISSLLFSSFFLTPFTLLNFLIRFHFFFHLPLRRTIILFDEIEEFCLDRENPALGMESRMLTTAMLTQVCLCLRVCLCKSVFASACAFTCVNCRICASMCVHICVWIV